MGFNLGAFAGGMNQGIVTQQKFQQDQDRLKTEKDFRDRQLKMQEQDQAFQEEQRNKQRDLDTDVKSINDKYFKPQQITGQDGAVQTVAPLDMTDPTQMARKLSYMTDLMAAKVKHTSDPTQLAPVFDYIDKIKGTQFGRDVYEAINGNQDKMGAVVKQFGGDPTKAHFDQDKMVLDLGNGKPPVPMQQFLAMGGAWKFAELAQAQKKDSREDKVTDAQVSNLGATTEQTKAKTRDIIPAEAANLRAHTGLANAQAGLANAKASAVGSNAKTDASIKEYTALSKTNPIKDPVPDDSGKVGAWNEAEGLRLTLFAQARQGGKNSAAAYSAATDGVTEVANMADKQARQVVQAIKAGKIDKKDNPYGTMNVGQIKKQIFNKLVEKNFKGAATAVPAASSGRAGNLSTDEE